MAVKTKAQILAEIAALFADNTTGDISASDLRTVCNDITDSYFDAPYKKYVALLNQTGTNAPTATVLENTTGVVPTYAYAGVGSYEINSTGLFTVGKTWFSIISQEGATRWNIMSQNNVNQLLIDTTDASGTGANDVLLSCPIEIRIYV